MSEFKLSDNHSGLNVEYYNLPNNWRGAGRTIMLPNRHLTWQTIFVNDGDGTLCFRNGPLTFMGMGGWRNLPIMQNGNLLNGILSDLRPFLGNCQNINLIDSNFAPNNRANAARQSGRLGQMMAMMQVSVADFDFTGKLALLRQGRKCHAEICSSLTCQDMGGGFLPIASSSVIVNCSYGCFAPEANFASNWSSFLGVLRSRREDGQFKKWLSNYNSKLVQSRKQVSQASRPSTQSNSGGRSSILDQAIQARDKAYRDLQSSIKRSNDLNSKVAQGWCDVIRERTDMVNPYDPSQKVETNNNYHYAWVNREGEVINTDSCLFNPNTDYDFNSTEWTQIK
ncbi:hypothetical protein IJT10_03255 [bacterium]|nr:hypothetical protein [bacterium]